MSTGELPTFVTVTVCGKLLVPTSSEPKLRLVGLILRDGSAGGRPVPANGTKCGLPGALLEMTSVACLKPDAGGVNRIPMAHEAPGGMSAAIQV
jgi:hypothetical protein